MIILFVVKKIKKLELIDTTAAKFYQYLKATIRYALEKELIIKNPCEFISFKNDFKRHCKTKQKKIQIVSDENMKLLKMQLELDHTKMENYIPSYAVEFAMLTGMRVGEISALKWECVNFEEEYILIYESEKSNRKKNEFHIDDTKNGKIRTFPITTEIKELLLRIQKVQKKFDKKCIFVFEDENGRIHAKTISACSQTKCRQLKINPTGIHKYRKTLNSKMRCANVSNVITSELLGNTRQVNEEHYTFDTTNNQFKKQMLEAII